MTGEDGPSLAAARNSYLTNIVAAFAIASLLMISGFALLHFYIKHAELLPPGARPIDVGDKLMPHFFATQLPLGFGGLIFVRPREKNKMIADLRPLGRLVIVRTRRHAQQRRKRQRRAQHDLAPTQLHTAPVAILRHLHPSQYGSSALYQDLAERF